LQYLKYGIKSFQRNNKVLLYLVKKTGQEMHTLKKKKKKKKDEITRFHIGSILFMNSDVTPLFI